MLIGIDGNEANVKQRVGSSQYALELLKVFAKISNYSSSDPERSEGESRSYLKNMIDLKVSSRQARTIKFVIYLKEQPLPDLPQKTENFKYKVFGPKKFWTQIALPIRLSIGDKPDVFFSMAHYGPRFTKVPYVVTIHDLSYIHYPELFKKNDLYQLTTWSKYSIENSVHIIAVSETTKKDIVKNYGVKPSKITVTYEGYDKSRFKPQPQSAIDRVKKHYGINGPYIIFVGTLQPRKNLERLIEAFRQILQDFTPGVRSMRHPENTPGVSLRDLTLVIAGKKGWMYDQIFQKAKEQNLENKVIFTDFVPDSKLPALIAGSTCYVLPSLWEGFGIPVIEAQACGVPVVVSNTSSLPEIVSAAPFTPDVKSGRRPEHTSGVGQNTSAILVDPENTDSIVSGIKKVITSPKLSQKLVSLGFANIKRFSWQKCALETLRVLEKVASRSNPIV